MNIRTSRTWAMGWKRAGLVIGLTAWGPTLATVACGSDDSLVCGEGTVRKGGECVAKEVPTPDAGEDETGGKTSTGGATSSGGVVSTGGKGGENTGGKQQEEPDSGEPPTDGLKFSGATSASPASQTPPAGNPKTGADAIRVSWEPATYDAQPNAVIHYEIFWSEESGEQNFKAPQELAPPGSTGFTLQGLNPKTTYYFVVRAVADRGISKDGNVTEVSSRPKFDDTAPAFDGAKTAAAAGPTSVKVSWPDAEDDMTSKEGLVYRVYWTDDKDGKNLRLGAVSVPGATSTVVSGLGAPETDYYFRTLAVDAAGNVDANTTIVRGKTGKDETPPIFAGCNAATDPSASTAILTWLPGVDDTTPADKLTYTVYASDVPIDQTTDFTALQVVGAFTGGVTRGQVSGLSPSTRYRFICRASDASKNEETNFVIQTAITGSDGSPPTFDGLDTAVADATSVTLTWKQAHDDQTADRDVIYRVYASTKTGTQDLTNPVLTTQPGVLGIMVQKQQLLTIVAKVSNQDFFFVVRASDAAGNVDDNKVEKTVKTLTSFADDVQPIFNTTCAVTGCHTGADPTFPPPQGQILDEGVAYSYIVNVIAREGVAIGEPTIKRVNTNKVLLDSYLYRKITGTQPINGSSMPPSTALKPLSLEERDTIIAWITAGAPNN